MSRGLHVERSYDDEMISLVKSGDQGSAKKEKIERSTACEKESSKMSMKLRMRKSKEYSTEEILNHLRPTAPLKVIAFSLISQTTVEKREVNHSSLAVVVKRLVFSFRLQLKVPSGLRYRLTLA